MHVMVVIYVKKILFNYIQVENRVRRLNTKQIERLHREIIIKTEERKQNEKELRESTEYNIKRKLSEKVNEKGSVRE